ncbi:hypothetical protein CANARDRAFT_177369 [[Candida] arabinofermentans NRRL YB-2248]|uniref:C2H2-type domain-containing protein n=1 Tax=[Candida] arabinofermentans NRRL YB-2248 TaxID=983967 RepID=A0A1E4SWP5_9ASCO|nr:hypothetical protein CANARDRAFT_177369 [[Candida] arabinofermentans NRRL YB-2248]
MTSTLKRTLTDIMEDELYTVPHSQHQHNQNQNQNQFYSDDLSNYLNMDGSQDYMLQNDDTVDNQHQQQNQSPINNQYNHMTQQHQQPSQYLDNIYNSYANPNLFANSTFPDDLYTFEEQRQFSNYNQEFNNNDINPKDTARTIDNKSEVSNHDDVLLIPQDNYLVYDNNNQNEFIQFELAAAKSFPQSNELNIFKTDYVYLDEDFSDDEEDDDDEDFDDNQNKLDDMEMDLDDLSSESSFGDINDQDENYFMNNDNLDDDDDDVEDVQLNNHSSIYALTTPQTINPRMVQYDDYINSNSNDNNAVFYEDDEDDEEDEDEGNFSDASDDLYTPAFEQRRESVIAEHRPTVIKVEKQEAPSPVLRKLKTSTTTTSSKNNNSISSENSNNGHISEDVESDEMEHVCLIENPKSGQPCNKRFSRPYDLVRHQNTIHASKRSYYRCMFCEDDLRRRNNLEPTNEIILSLDYRSSSFSIENSNTNAANSHNSKKLKSSANNGEFLSNKTFSRCDALTRHLRFRHGLNNQQVNDAMDYAKKHVEYYEN